MSMIENPNDRLDGLVILFVEDESSVRELLPRLLARRGAKVMCAQDGEEGIALFKRHRPHMVISDIRMPNMDGLTMSREIRQLDADVPIFILTAHDEVDLLKASIDIGVSGYLSKPVDAERLLHTLLEMRDTLQSKKQELNELHQKVIEADIQTERLSTYVSHCFSAQLSNAPPANICHLDMPLGKVSGDFFCTESHQDAMYLMVGDGTGHGLSAIVPVLQVPRIFHRMAAKNYSLLAIADEINSELRKHNFMGHFLAATLVRMDMLDGYVEVINFGNPPAILMGADGQVLHEFSPDTFALGMVGAEEFSAPLERYRCQKDANLYIYTDGVTDTLASAYPEMLEKGMGEFFGNMEPGGVYAKVQSLIEQAPARARMDDITFVEAHFRKVEIEQAEPKNKQVFESIAKAVEGEKISMLVIAPENADWKKYEKDLGILVSMFYEARSAEEGLEMFRLHRPALVMVEVSASVGIGLELLEQMRSMDTKTMLIVAGMECSGQCIERMLDINVSKFLQMPADDTKLIAAVRSCVEQYRTSYGGRLLASVFESFPLATLVADKESKIVAINPAFTRITGYTLDEVYGRNPNVLSSGKQDASFYKGMWHALKNYGIWSGKIYNRRKNGEIYMERISINTINDEYGEIANYVATFTEIPSEGEEGQIKFGE